VRARVSVTGALAAFAATVIAGTAMSPAATFPGTNGKITFERSVGGDTEVFVMDADGQNQVNLTDNSANDFVPEFSPDGERIVFQSNRDAQNEIYSMAADGTDVTRLTTDAADDGEPSYSSDGTKIAFVSDRDGEDEIFVMNSDGTNPVQLTFNGQREADPTFSPDGRRIAFTSERDGDAEIFSMTADGQDQTNLTENGFDDEEPNYSPDLPGAGGTPAPVGQIAFSSDRDGDLEIVVMSSSGANETPITSNTTPDREPAFSPDGSLIAFRRIGFGDEIWRMALDGQSQIQLTGGPGDESPSWQPLNPPQIDVTTGKQKSAKSVTVTVASQNENATVTLDGTLKAAKPRPKAFASKKKTVKLDAVIVQLQPGVPQTVDIPVAGKGKKLIKKARKAGKPPKGTVTVTATDDLGAAASDSTPVKYKKKRKKK
jgi:dipeptidyl aminopeptidase/acylaminoacyl peptidase